MRSSSASELVALIGQTGMETCWVYALLRVICALQPGAHALGWGACFALQLTAAGAARAAAGLPLSAAVRRLGLAVVELALFWVFVRNQEAAPVPLVWITGLFLSARGTLIGSQSAHAEHVRRWYLIGAIALVVLYALLARAGVSPSALPESELQALTSAYFLGGACVCAVVERQRLPSQQTAAFAFALGLPLAGLAVSGALLGASALGIQQLMASGQRGALASLGAIWRVVQWLARVLASVLRALGASTGAAPPDTARLGRGDAELPFGLGRLHDPLARTQWDALPGVLALGALAVVGMFLVAWLGARVQVRDAERVEERRSLLSWAGVWRRWRGRIAALSSAWDRGGAVLDALRERGTPRDMRAVYRRVLRWAAAHGQPRRDGTTPIEFAEELGRRHPDRRHQLQVITAYYNAVRYGGQPLSDDQLEHARALLADVTRES